MRRNVCPDLVFSNGTYIFDSNFQQIDPKDPQGLIIESILARQKKDKIDSLPQKYRAEVAHNKDINNDGIIGDPDNPKPKRKKKKKTKRFSLAKDSSDDSVNDSNNKALR